MYQYPQLYAIRTYLVHCNTYQVYVKHKPETARRNQQKTQTNEKKAPTQRTKIDNTNFIENKQNQENSSTR